MFKCKYSKPNARVRWLKNKLEIFHGHKYSFLTEDGYFKLVIRRIGMEDAGRYTCQADDKTSSAYLEVEGVYSYVCVRVCVCVCMCVCVFTSIELLIEV